MPIPYDRSYWVIPDKFLAGCYPGDLKPSEARKKLTGLIAAGVRYIINLTQEDELSWYGHRFVSYAETMQELAREAGVVVTCVRIPIQDYSIPALAEMRGILDTIDRAIAVDLPVFVHCIGGKGRTGIVVGCYLARHGIAVGQEALNRIRELRRNLPEAADPSPENELQRQLVRSWIPGR